MTDTPTDSTDTPTAPGPGSPTRRLTRSRDDRVLGGVASGIARYLDVDPIFVRVGFVVAAVLAGVGVLAYVAGWLLIPEDDSPPASGRRLDLRQLAGCALLGIGLLVALGRFGFWVDQQVVWAIGLIVIGGAVLWLRGRDTRATGDAPPPPAPPPVPLPPTLPPRAEYSSAPVTPTRYGVSPPDFGAPSAPWSRPRPPRPREHRTPSKLGVLTFCVLLVAGGIALALNSADVIDLSAAAALGGAVALIGMALVVGAWWGRARWLIAPAVALALFAALFSLLDVPLGGGIGEGNYHPRSVAAVERDYELGIGSLKIDLRDVDFSGGARAIDASIGIGELKVWVPDGARVVVDEHLSVGELDNFGESDPDGGADLDRHVVRRGREGAGRLHLDLEGGFGSIKVIGTR